MPLKFRERTWFWVRYRSRLAVWLDSGGWRDSLKNKKRKEKCRAERPLDVFSVSWPDLLPLFRGVNVNQAASH